MAHLIISEKVDEVYSLMKKIGNDGVVHKEYYKSWPLFYKLRKEEKFKMLYKEIFKDDYKVLEIPKRPIQELIEELVEKNPKLIEDKTEKVAIKKKASTKRKVPTKKNVLTKKNAIKKVSTKAKKENDNRKK